MGNLLFQEARKWVDNAKSADQGSLQEVMEKAKNALSSAYANSTPAEQLQLSQLQSELDQLSKHL